MASAPTDEVWWHRRVVLVSNDSTWTSRMLDLVPARAVVAEASTWIEAARVTGPVGALVCHIDRPRALSETITRACEHWSSLAWQPCTLTWIASRPGAARIRAVLDRHGFRVVCTSEFTLSRNDDTEPWDEVRTRLDAAPWIVPLLAQRLSWSHDPRLVEILSAPVLGHDISTVRAWGRGVRLSYGELAGLCRRHGACPPKQLLDVVRLAAGLARVQANGRRVTRDRLASRLGYSSGNYLGRRVKTLCGCTVGDLIGMPLMGALEVLLGLTTHGSRQN